MENYLYTIFFLFFTDTFKVPSPGLYSPEKVHPQGERHAPQYSISARTKMRRIDPNPAPNQYTLPPIIGSKQPNKPAAPAYVMTSRTEVLYSDQKCLLLIQYLYFFLYIWSYINILYMSYWKEIYEILQLRLWILSKFYGNYGIFLGVCWALHLLRSLFY